MSIEPTNFSGKRIIIIEDNQLLLQLLANKLIKNGAEVHQFTNGSDGLRGIIDLKPDLVLLDIMLPIMNGYEVLEAMKVRGLTEQYPVLIISNSGQPVEIERVMQLGVIDYLVKVDFTPQEVLEKASAILERNEKAVSSKIDEAPEAIDTRSQKIIDESNDTVRTFVVEDDPMLRNILSKKFQVSSIPSMFTNDGAQAFELAKQYEPTVIVLDLMLPGKDGFEILAELKQDEGLAEVPVIIFSNRSEPEDVNRCMELGAVKFLVKATTNLNDLVKDIKQFSQQ